MMDNNLLKLMFVGVVAVVVLKMWQAHRNGGMIMTMEDDDGTEEFTPADQTGADSDLLPPPARADDFTPDPDVLTGRNFLDASRWTSLNTVSGARRNSSYDIRDQVPIPKQNVSPWGQSDITPDLMRRPLN